MTFCDFGTFLWPMILWLGLGWVIGHGGARADLTRPGIDKVNETEFGRDQMLFPHQRRTNMAGLLTNDPSKLRKSQLAWIVDNTGHMPTWVLRWWGGGGHLIPSIEFRGVKQQSKDPWRSFTDVRYNHWKTRTFTWRQIMEDVINGRTKITWGLYMIQ